MATRKLARRSGAAEEEVTKQRVVNILVGTIGSMTDQIFNLRAEKAALAEQIKLIEAKIETVETELIGRLDAEGSTKGSGKSATCSISSAEVYNVIDWVKVDAYAKKTGYMHIYQRRLSVDAVREIVEKTGKPVPGTEPFTKRRLNVRSL